jgi:phospholipid N-methyltransferase
MFTNLFFVLEGIKHFQSIGTVTRTSKSTAKGILSLINFDKAKHIVELGAGDGAITKTLLNNMTGDSQLFVFEVNTSFCSALKKIKDERLFIINDSAENVRSHLNSFSVENVDLIISTLPFILIPHLKRDKILGQCLSLLQKHGFFYQLHYTLGIKNLYKSYFDHVHTKFFLWNVPPAYLFVCNNNGSIRI